MTARLNDTELLARLVAFDSTSRNSNLPIADFICDYVYRTGIRIHRNPSPDGNKVNLFIVAGPAAAARRGLGLSGHMDVVPALESEWHSDPFTLTERDSSYFGRGTCDMKGFLAIAVNRLAAADLDRLRYPLALLLTYDEELGTLGAKQFVETWHQQSELPQAMIIGEPTSLSVVRMHKGYLKLRLEFSGVAAHSGYPHLGRNAIEPAGRAIVALAELRHELERERPPYSEHFAEVPFAALNVATVSGGVAMNVIPDRCQVELGVRLLPGMSSSDVVGRVQSAVAGAVSADEVSLQVLGESPAMILPEDSPIHRLLREQMGQQEGRSVSFATDAGWLQTLHLECVIFGPGSITVAHKPNEYLPIAEFERAATVLERVIEKWCMRGSGA